MQRYDVIIVGGGPAGSSCAWALRDSGLRVLLLDAKRFPRDKICAGWVTPEVFTSLAIDLADYASRRTLQPFHGFATGLVGETALRTDYQRVVSFGIRRVEFDHYLLERASAADSVTLRLGEKITKINFANALWTVNNRWCAPLLVGAGGTHCPVASHLNRGNTQRSDTMVAQEVEFQLDQAGAEHCAVQAEFPELYFSNDFRGYGWLMRKGNYLNVGLGRERSDNLSRQVQSFAAWLQREHRFPSGLPLRFKGYAYRVYRQPAGHPVGDGVLLLGDAAGLAHPRSGEGVRPAVESALLAAEVIKNVAPDFSSQQLGAYTRKLHDHFGAPLQAEPSALHRLGQRKLGAALLRNKLFARHVLLDRWFLHRGRAPVLG